MNVGEACLAVAIHTKCSAVWVPYSGAELPSRYLSNK